MFARTFRLLAAPLFALLVFTGCEGAFEGDYRPRATGPEGEIMVVIDSTHWNAELGDAVRQHIGPYVETLPTPERSFDLQQVNLASDRMFDIVQRHKNVVFAAPLNDDTPVSNFLRSRLSDDVLQATLDGTPVVVPRNDLWRRSQRVYYMTAANSEQLAQAIEERGPEIRDTFHKVTLDRMEREMFEKERQYDLEDTLMQHHGFAVNVQHDYQIAIDTTTENRGFIWLRRVLTDTRRELFVHYVDGMAPSDITPEWIYATRDSLTEKYLRGNVAGFVRTDYRRPLNTEETEFLDRYAYITRGLWHFVRRPDEGDGLQEMGGGGPFVNYTFYDQETGRVYMINGAVFAPEHGKRDFLRQMEVIARTFRTQAETQSEETLASSE
ncbi:DUF4837 domain-containing protein [Longimonas halophila]|uniref:DUF4837 domain-containing protein n=1 Tax=Longimonas halophila TaxID=1469170 RepID=A0A2H3NQS4_9BACT|nr:DUF4837 family protein [Longimonas halophila]PEN08023.1 DUF4837 domain-containing protein [Longimonas halophila]